MTVEGAASGRAQTLKRDLGDEAVQSWRVSLNLDALTQIETPDGARISTTRGVPLTGHHLDLEIPGRGPPLRLHLDTTYEGYAGVITYAGVIEGDDGSLVAISVDGDEILGKIHHTEGFTYLLESDPLERDYTLSVIDQRLIPRIRNSEDPVEVKQHEEHFFREHWFEAGMSDARPFSGGNVRLLILYTPAAAAQNNITWMANNIVSLFNQSLIESDVESGYFVTLADLRSIGDNLATHGSRCNFQIRNNMGNRIGAFADLDTWMEVAEADIGLAIVTAEPSYTECPHGPLGRIGGRATFIPEFYFPHHPRPFAVTTDSFAIADLTAIHELGHVLNGRHEDDCAVANPPAACAYVRPVCQWQTIMGGYRPPCGFDPQEPVYDQPTPRIGRWSNPDVYYNGHRTGTGSRNMAAALEFIMPHAAGWGGGSTQPPAEPNPIDVSPAYCWGLNFVEWTAQDGASDYRLYRSYSPSFTTPFLLYSGTGTSTHVNVSQTAYLRAQACNSGGCSPYSSQVQVNYHPGCS